MNKLWFMFGMALAVAFCLHFVKDDIASLQAKINNPDVQAYTKRNLLP